MGDADLRLGYGLVWVGPQEPLLNYGWFAIPDIPLIALRMFALTAIAAAALMVTWKLKNKNTEVRDG